TYAGSLAAATEKIRTRLDSEYGKSAALIARLEQFELSEANNFTRAGIPLSQCLLPEDVFLVCEDLLVADQSEFHPATQRLARDFELQRQAHILKANQPLMYSQALTQPVSAGRRHRGR
ncbi:MAG: hypothetical protein SGJ19_23325, partial [Planctomycetia bacterium]|nr:hypothetical protein [Planctomycetia bacterium]